MTLLVVFVVSLLQARIVWGVASVSNHDTITVALITGGFLTINTILTVILNFVINRYRNGDKDGTRRRRKSGTSNTDSGTEDKRSRQSGDK